MLEHSPHTDLSAELAQLAARHIAEEGLSYAQAKRKAAKQCGVSEHNAVMPSNPAVEQALRQYQADFQSYSQPQELLRLRRMALRWISALQGMDGLEHTCTVLAIGAVVNGTAGEHSPVRLDVYTDECKHFEMALLNAGHSLDYSETAQAQAMLIAQDQGVPIVMTIKNAQPVPPPNAPIDGYFQIANALLLKKLIEKSDTTP